MGIAVMQVSAQPGNPQGTRTTPVIETIVGNNFNLEITCDGEVVDVLNFPQSFDLRVMIHFKNNSETWGKYKLNNIIMTSALTGEVFNTQSKENDYSYVGGVYRWHLNLNGNKGHHYTVQMVYETTNWEIIYYHSSCN